MLYLNIPGRPRRLLHTGELRASAVTRESVNEECCPVQVFSDLLHEAEQKRHQDPRAGGRALGSTTQPGITEGILPPPSPVSGTLVHWCISKCALLSGAEETKPDRQAQALLRPPYGTMTQSGGTKYLHLHVGPMEEAAANLGTPCLPRNDALKRPCHTWPCHTARL